MTEVSFSVDPGSSGSTHGLVPYRLRRIRPDGTPVLMDANEADRWAASQPWFGRVRVRRSDRRWFTWFVVAQTEAELASVEVR